MINTTTSTSSTGLVRRLGLLGLAATGICSMLGASINVVPFMIQRNVPGIGPYVLPAFLLAAVPAILAAFAYSLLASAMPRAGGSYLYASRGLHPYLGFVASFSQWFGLSIVIGVIAYVVVPFFRDIALGLGWSGLAAWLEVGWVRISLAVLLLWTFVLINIRGAKSYERTLIPLMFLMFGLGAIVIVAGFWFSADDFTTGVQQAGGNLPVESEAVFHWPTFLAAAALLFSSFIGFDSIAQAGGEAKNPNRNLPLAIALAITVVGCFYFLFTLSVYRIVPWQFVAQEAMQQDISAPGLLRYVLPAGLAVAIVAGAAIALINDLPAMLLSVSRLMFAWAEDRIFSKRITVVHPVWHTPHVALLLSGGMATVGILGSHFAGDFFLGIDIMVTSMMVNFLLMCFTLVTITRVNPMLAQNIRIVKSRSVQLVLGWGGTAVLTGFLIIHTWKDLHNEVDAWYFHSTYIWLIVMLLASVFFFIRWFRLKKQGINLRQQFLNLPPE
ncbi:APC family permease [Tunicatimonas pelagia]|uniref:APC family permease n=1 Tax=Tunicatimonas pelagia TaxID=931531 RepID=UPI0026657843|nr:APC family permease [Tunicatimonas pelagia]WKN43392.1 APC family permease [Tunicatimonas pelagia]